MKTDDFNETEEKEMKEHVEKIKIKRRGVAEKKTTKKNPKKTKT